MAIFMHSQTPVFLSFPGSSDSKESACNMWDLGSVPGMGRSPGRRHGDPLQYSCLENLMDRGAWRTTVHGVAESWTWLSNWAQHAQSELIAFAQPRNKEVVLTCTLHTGITRGPWSNPCLCIPPGIRVFIVYQQTESARLWGSFPVLVPAEWEDEVLPPAAEGLSPGPSQDLRPK